MSMFYFCSVQTCNKKYKTTFKWISHLTTDHNIVDDEILKNPERYLKKHENGRNNKKIKNNHNDNTTSVAEQDNSNNNDNNDNHDNNNNSEQVLPKVKVVKIPNNEAEAV